MNDLSMTREAIVVGGGVAGLSCAHALRKAGVDVEVLEAAREPGGNVRTAREGGYLLERGPHTFMGSSRQLLALIDDLGLTGRMAATGPAARDRYIVKAARAYKAPLSPWAFIRTGLLSPRAKLTLATEPFRRTRTPSRATAGEFFRNRFGAEAAHLLAGAFIAGVYAGDPDALCAESAFPLFWGFERDTGSMIRGALKHRRASRRAVDDGTPGSKKGLFSFGGGLGILTDALAASLGPRLTLGLEAREIHAEHCGGFSVLTDAGRHRCRNLVVAVPPHRVGGLLRGLDPAAALAAGAIPMAPVVVLQLGFNGRLEEIPEGFGFLAPRGEGIRCLGTLFVSRLFADRAPGNGDLLTAFIGGSLDPEAASMPDDALLAVVMNDLGRLFGVGREPSFLSVARHVAAIPQLTVGHMDRVAALRSCERANPGLLFAGNYLKGVGLKDAVASGLDAAAALLLANEGAGRAA